MYFDDACIIITKALKYEKGTSHSEKHGFFL